MKPKRNLFALLGWAVWKLAALLGSSYAARKLEQPRPRTGLTPPATERTPSV